MEETSNGDDEEIKTMKLYCHLDRIEKEILARGISSGEPIDPFVLSEIDSMHYLGNSAIEEAVRAIKPDSSSKVLDIGSGFGGPARVLSALSKTHTTALELQPDVHKMAEDLTRRCNLSDLVKHMPGNILDCDVATIGDGPDSFNGIVSFLVFLHIPDKLALLKRCSQMLKPGGVLFVEDFYARSAFTPSEVGSLDRDVYCKDLPTRESYIQATEAAGFDDIEFFEMTTEWTDFVTERRNIFVTNRERFTDTHGKSSYEGLIHFYNAVVALFEGGNLGGVRLVARKK